MKDKTNKTTFEKVKDAFSWVIFVVLLVTFVTLIYRNVTAPNDGMGSFLLGYKPVYIMTGSMEPYMKTNGIALTKKVTEIEELEVGDVITFSVENQNGDPIFITHRIESMENGFIMTKGDNNDVNDGIPLTMDNVEAKVVGVWNGSAWIVEKWQSSNAGKVMLISIAIFIICAYYLAKSLIKAIFHKISGTTEDTSIVENTGEENTVINVAEDPQDNKTPKLS